MKLQKLIPGQFMLPFWEIDKNEITLWFLMTFTLFFNCRGSSWSCPNIWYGVTLMGLISKHLGTSGLMEDFNKSSWWWDFDFVDNKDVDSKEVDNKVADYKVSDYKIVDYKVVDNRHRVVDNRYKVVDNKTVDNKVLENKVVDKKYWFQNTLVQVD